MDATAHFCLGVGGDVDAVYFRCILRNKMKREREGCVGVPAKLVN